MSKKKGGNNYWRNRIKAEKNQNKRSRERLRSKGETATKKRSSGKIAPKTGSWASKIRAEKGRSSTAKNWRAQVNASVKKRAKKSIPNKKLATLKNNIRRSRINAQIKGSKVFNKPAISRSSNLRNVKPVQRVRQPVSNKKAISLMKKGVTVDISRNSKGKLKIRDTGVSKIKQAIMKAPPVKSPVKKQVTPSKGASLLKSKLTKPAISKAPQKSAGAPSKGASLLKKSVGNIVNKPREVKRVKQSVVRRGR